MAIANNHHSLLRGLLANPSHDLFAGVVSSVLSIAYGLSFAALIFSGPLTPWLGYGIAATFLATAVGASIVAARSSLPFTIGGPDSSTSAVTATLVATLLPQLAGGGGAGEQLVVPALMVMSLGAGLTGLLLCGLGLTRAGRATCDDRGGGGFVPSDHVPHNGVRHSRRGASAPVGRRGTHRR